MNKHLKLLTKIPTVYFSCYGFIMDKIKQDIKENKHISDSDIARCYYGLYHAMTNNKTDYTPKITDNIQSNCYDFLDYTNPDINHFYNRIYKSNFLLPKMYKNVFVNTKPANNILLIKPKTGVNFQEALSLKQNFLVKSYICNLRTFGSMINPLKSDHLENCYHSLKQLLAKTEFIYNDKPNKDKGSVILAKELNNLLSNQDILYNKQLEIKYAPSARTKIISDIVAHKCAMFGELQKQY